MEGGPEREVSQEVGQGGGQEVGQGAGQGEDLVECPSPPAEEAAQVAQLCLDSPCYAPRL